MALVLIVRRKQRMIEKRKLLLLIMFFGDCTGVSDSFHPEGFRFTWVMRSCWTFCKNLGHMDVSYEPSWKVKQDILVLWVWLWRILVWRIRILGLPSLTLRYIIITFHFWDSCGNGTFIGRKANKDEHCLCNSFFKSRLQILQFWETMWKEDCETVSRKTQEIWEVNILWYGTREDVYACEGFHNLEL